MPDGCSGGGGEIRLISSKSSPSIVPCDYVDLNVEKIDVAAHVTIITNKRFGQRKKIKKKYMSIYTRPLISSAFRVFSLVSR